MSGHYETREEIIKAFKQQGISVEWDQVNEAMIDTGLGKPLDDEAIDELVSYFGPNLRRTDSPEERVRRVLEDKRWREAVINARWRLRLPTTGLSRKEANSYLTVLVSRNSKQQIPAMKRNLLERYLEVHGASPKVLKLCQEILESSEGEAILPQ